MISKRELIFIIRLELAENGKEDVPTPAFFDGPPFGNVGPFPRAAKSTIMNIKDRIGDDEIDKLFKNSLGGVMKMAYALVWQVL